MKKAVILNAGEGKRLRPLTQGKPKCLLKINGVTILEHQLDNLVECGIKDALLVVGYHSQMIMKSVEKGNFKLHVTYVYNPIFDRTNTVYSLLLAMSNIDAGFVYLNGDVIFHSEVLKRLLNSPQHTSIAIVKKKVKEEEVKVQIKNYRVTRIGKELDPARAYGEFIGIAKFSQRFAKLLKEKLNEIIMEGKSNAFFERALDRTLKLCKVFGLDITDLPCIEIDTLEDFHKAKRMYLKIV